MADILTNERGEKYILLEGKLYRLTPMASAGAKRGRPKGAGRKPKGRRGRKARAETATKNE